MKNHIIVKFLFFTQRVSDKKWTKKLVQKLNLKSDDGIYDWKTFDKVKIVFIDPLWIMANLSMINLSL